MNFWKDPSQNATKSLVLIAMVVLAGFGLYKLAGTPDNSQTGKVIQGTKFNTTNPDYSLYAKETCKPPVSLGLQVGDSCSIADSSCNPVSGTTQQCQGAGGNTFACCCLSTVGSPYCVSGAGVPGTPVENTGNTPRGTTGNDQL